MTLESIDGHSLDVDLLTESCLVLDVGCRGFNFGNALRSRFRANVYELDIDVLDTTQLYYRIGLSAYEGKGDVSNELDGHARRLIEGEQVAVTTLQSFSRQVRVEDWAVIKLNCEGSEFDILQTLASPMAKQIVVSFHEHTVAQRGDIAIDKLLDRLRQWYDVHNHIKESRYGCRSNYWDTLLIRRF